MIVTELTKMLGIRVPVVQGGMQWVHPPASLPLLRKLTWLRLVCLLWLLQYQTPVVWYANNLLRLQSSLL